MEPWITVVVAAIVALSTLGATFLQSWFSNKRFKIEIGRAIDVDYRKRKWEVRSVPLLKLRDELAIMASKYDLYFSAEQLVLVKSSLGMKKEEAIKELKNAIDKWDTYRDSGALAYTMYMQYDPELASKVEDIRINYPIVLSSLNYRDASKLSETEENIKKVRDKIVEIQELINERLEKL